MNTDPKARDLFIVDNSISGWTGLRYLEEWAGIAKGFDVATGYFEIGSLLALDGKWQGLDKIRILMGGEITYRTRKLMLEAVKVRALAHLDANIEADKDANPFLRGVPAILAALQSGQIECRVYDCAKFHAKAYITHSKLEVVGSQALVGSSNFTRPGLTENIELNVQIQSAREVAQLQEWFEAHWNLASPSPRPSLRRFRGTPNRTRRLMSTLRLFRSFSGGMSSRPPSGTRTGQLDPKHYAPIGVKPTLKCWMELTE
ncbi:MAG TPA: phospholipase D-like domain-containing protein [Thermoanaerobaculia bacterium]|nr:phospholipase D-like domain-containing protein [Thermoanaerobaculia bacterium]